MIKKTILFFGILMFYTSTLYAAVCDPFTINCGNNQGALTKYPLSALSMAGVIYKDDQVWALIKAPDQHVYPVAVNEPIGLGGGKVVHIAARQLVVQQEKNTFTMRLQSIQR